MKIDEFDIGQLLGRGGFASVYQARIKATGIEVALKIMNKSIITTNQLSLRVINEIKTHDKLHHPSIIELIDYFEDEQFVYFVLELCQYGNFFQYLKKNGPLTESQSAFLMYQLLQCLNYLHDNDIVHRDLKLSNILISKILNNHQNHTQQRQSQPHLIIKLCDFGLAASIEHPDEEHYTLCGTPNYIAPEIALQQAHGFPVDIWSLGCLFYSMLTGTLPFDQGGVRETLQKIMTGEYEKPAHISENASDFLHRLLELVRYMQRAI